MKRLDAYEQQTPNWTRVEMLLAAFEGVIERLRLAQDFVVAGQNWKAQPLLLRAQRIVLELYSGLDLRHGEVPDNMGKLYLFVLHSIGMGESLNLAAALDVLGIIREGLNSIRDTANELERRGQVPHAPYQTHILQDVAG
ncbi:MAG: flagellar protein FliS [Planctomycetia bacterium]|nr:flagellar protein FliS [Planctomycetia bacterium]